MFSYLGGKDASSCIIQLSTEDPDSQKEQTTNLPSLHDFVVSLTISRPISCSHELATDFSQIQTPKKAVGFVSKLDIDRWPPYSKENT